MAGVQAQVAHHAVEAAEGHNPLPVDRLLRIEVAGVEKPGCQLDDPSQGAGIEQAAALLHGGEEGKLRRAAHEQVGPGGGRGEDRPIGRQVDPERFFAHQVLAGRDRRHIDLGVEVVRQGHVDGVDLGMGEQLAVIGRRQPDRIEPLGKPIAHGRTGVADRRDDGPGRRVGQVAPAGRGAGELASHQPPANDPPTHRASHRW